MIVYALRCTCHPEEGIRYVGQTVRSAKRRLGEHCRDSRTGTAIVYKWMRRHGADNIQLIVLEEVDDQAELDAAEAFWISVKRAENPWLLNMWKPTARPVTAPSLIHRAQRPLKGAPKTRKLVS